MTQDGFTNAMATSGLTSPFWLPFVTAYAPLLSFIFIVVSILWVVIQIYFKLKEK